MIGQLLAGRYRVLQVLGAGGFGQTYITEDLHLPGQPKCVLKHLKPASTSLQILEIARKLFQKEAETLQQLGSYDQIPRLLAFFEEKQEFYLVQEYIIGHTLSTELGGQRQWVESAVQRLLREILTILEFVHGQGVIHRDIKPDNIMRRDVDGKLVLIDFGAIKQVRTQQYPDFGEVTKTIAIGTPGYMPLEQAGGTPRPSSDLYALGIICIQALTGRQPTELPEDNATGELQWRQFVNISPPLLAFLTKITSSHFRDRYATAHEALQALHQLDAGATYPPSATTPAGVAPVNISPPTVATRVVSPATETFNFKPSATAHFPVSVARPDEPSRRRPLSNVVKGLIASTVLLSSVGVGYLFVRPQLIADNFDTLVTTNRCRMTTPNRVSGFMTKVRDVPDRTAPVKSKLAQGEKLLFVGTQAEFVQIEQRDGEKGWVFNDQIGSCQVAVPPSVSSSPTWYSPSPIPQSSVSKPPRVIKPSTPLVSPSMNNPADPSLDIDPALSPLPIDPAVTPTVNPVTPTPTAGETPFGVPIGAPLGAPLPTLIPSPPSPIASPAVPSSITPSPLPSSS
jgi:serine/threonine protein kinase